MIDTIILGLKDVYHNIKIFIILILSILTITTIFVSSTLSLFYTNLATDKTHLRNSYHLVPTSTDMSQNKNLVNDYFSFIIENGVSYFPSNTLTEKYDIATLIVVGDSTLIDQQIQQQDSTSGFLIADASETLNKIEYNGKEIKLESLNLSYDNQFLNEIAETPLILICLGNNEDLTKWLNYEDGDIVLQFIENSIFDTNAEKYEKPLLDIFDKSFISMKHYPVSDYEKKFIYTYIYPFICITMICVLISFWLIYSHFLRKMYREYMIHIFYGAKKKDILLRNSISMVFIFMISCIAFAFIKRGEKSIIANCGYLFIMIFVTFFELFTVFKISSNDKLKNIKGVSK